MAKPRKTAKNGAKKRKRRGDLRLTLPADLQKKLRSQATRDRRDIWLQARLYIEEGVASHG